jgi:plasmid stabilization system protein ParE
VNGARVEFFPEALREIDDAFDWYLERSPRAAESFLRDIDLAVVLIANAPKVWPRSEAGTRRYVLGQFPYNIIYREIEAGIQIVAVAHHKRQPRYWQGRLPPSSGAR